jgi:hypothetical protein
MPDRTQKTILSYGVNQDSVRAAVKSAEDIAKAQQAAALATVSSLKAQEAAYNQSLASVLAFKSAQAELNSVSALAARANSAAADALRTQTVDAARDAERAIADYEKALKRAEDQAARTAKASNEGILDASRQSTFNRDNIGDFSTFASQVAGATGNPFASALADATSFGEYLPNVAQGFRNLGAAAAENTGLIGKLAGQATALVPSLGAAGGGLVALGIAAAPVAALGLAASVALGEINKQLAASTEAGKREADVLLAGVDARTQASIALKQGDTEVLKQIEEDANSRQVAAQAIYDARMAERVAQRAVLEDLRLNPDPNKSLADNYAQFELEESKLYQIDDAVARAGTDLNNANAEAAGIAEVTQSLGARILTGVEQFGESLKKAQSDYERKIGTEVSAFLDVSALVANGLDLGGLKQETDSNAAAIDRQTEALRRLRDQGLANSDTYAQAEVTLSQLQARQSELTSGQTYAAAATNTLNNTLATFADTAAAARQQIDDLTSAYEANRSQVEAQRALQASDRAQDAALRNADKQEDLERALADQRAAQIERVRDIQEQAANAIKQANEEATKAAVAAAKATATAQADYQREALRREREFRQRLDDINRQYERSRETAILAQSVSGLLDAKTDAKDAKGSTRRDNRDDRADSQEDLALKLANIETERAAEQQASAEKLALIRAETITDIEESNAAFQNRLAKDEELRGIQNERAQRDSDIQNARRERDYALVDQAATARYAAELNSIGTVESKRLAADALTIANLETMEAVGYRLKSALAGVGSTPFGGVASAAGSALSGAQSGGLVGAIVGGLSALVNNPYQQSAAGYPFASSLATPGSRSAIPAFPVANNARASTVNVAPNISVQIEQIGDNVSMEQVYDTVVRGVNEGVTRMTVGIRDWISQEVSS